MISQILLNVRLKLYDTIHCLFILEISVGFDIKGKGAVISIQFQTKIPITKVRLSWSPFWVLFSSKIFVILRYR